MDNLASTIGLFLGLCTFIGGVVAWYRGSVEKDYAARRDFNHLQRNYENISNVLASGDEELEKLARNQEEMLALLRRFDIHLNDIARIQVEQKAFLISIANQVSGIFARLDGARSTGWGRES